MLIRVVFDRVANTFLDRVFLFLSLDPGSSTKNSISWASFLIRGLKCFSFFCFSKTGPKISLVSCVVFKLTVVLCLELNCFYHKL